MTERGSTTVVASDALVPYLPRISLEWLRADAGRRHARLDGTIAFVDISGFTALSERLAPKGRLGAEEVTDAISSTFTRLLGVAYEHGGGLVKFGGDALLLFFDGDAHAARACAAAHHMRSTLDEIGMLSTSAGPVELRMHAGIHSGEFDFFLVGGSHRELIVAGPGPATAVAMEDAAVAGEIAVSAATAAQLEAAVLGDVRETGRLLAVPPTVAPPGIAPVPDVEDLDLSACVPVALREHLLAEKVESEHRRAAIAFVRFSGLAPLLEDDPAAAAAAVEEVVVALQAAADAHGVCFLESDIDALGGRVVLVAGVPTTSGEDDERLLRTVRAAVDARTRLPLHVGVAAGNVFAGRIGPPYRRTYTILGGTAALAARLMAKAPERAVWTTPEVVEHSRTLFDTTALAPLALKGKSEPVEAVSVGSLGGARSVRTESLPLVDRQREMPVLEASLVPVKMGFGSFVELVGPAGIGKSRVLEEVCVRSGLPLVAAECEQYRAATPYSAFRQLLGSLLDIELRADPRENAEALAERVARLDAELVPWAPLLGDVLDADVAPTRQIEELQPTFRRARLHGVVEQVLTQLLPEPTLLLFEDTHWMDEASSDLLRHLGTRVPTKPWLICATRRPISGGFAAAEGTPPIPALTLHLDPIPEADAVELARASAADAVPPEELDAIIERAGGNPLFVRELVATRGGARAADALPESVEEVVTVRIDSLAPGDRALLRWASVLGATFSGELVARVLEADPDAALDSDSWDRLAEFVERDPYAPGTFKFRHALIRDAAYEGLSFRRRRELHARVAGVVREIASSEADVAETLATHFRLAEMPEETWTYSLLAAGRAKAKFANVDAAEFYRRALDASNSVPSLARADVGQAWEALGDVLELSGDYVEARRAYRQARAHLRGDHAALAGLAMKEGKLRENEGRYAQALRWYTRGLEQLELLGEPERTGHRLRLSLGYAGARLRQGVIDDCVVWAERVVAEARAANALKELAHAYYLLHLAYTSVGSPKRHDVRDLALPIYEELGDLLGQANALNNIGIDAYYEGRWQDALAAYERSRDARTRIGDVVGAAIIENNIAEILSDQGRLQEAVELFERVDATCRQAGSRLMTAVATSNLGRAAGRGGRTDDARRLLRDALLALLEIDASSFVVETEARLAEAALLAGEPEDALFLASALAKDTGSVSPAARALVHRIRGCALARLGRADEARAELDESLAVARAADALYEVAVTLEARARLTGVAADARDAAVIFETLGVVSVPKL